MMPSTALVEYCCSLAHVNFLFFPLGVILLPSERKTLRNLGSVLSLLVLRPILPPKKYCLPNQWVRDASIFSCVQTYHFLSQYQTALPEAVDLCYVFLQALFLFGLDYGILSG